MIRGGWTDGGRRKERRRGRECEADAGVGGADVWRCGRRTGASFLFSSSSFFNSCNRKRDGDWAWYDCRVLETQKYEASSSLSSSCNERNCNESFIFFWNVLHASECIIQTPSSEVCLLSSEASVVLPYHSVPLEAALWLCAPVLAKKIVKAIKKKKK